MNDDMNLHVEITGDSAGAVQSVSSLELRLSALEKAFNNNAGGAVKAADGVKKVASESERAAIKAEAMGGALSKLTALTNDVASHTRVATQALETLGLKSGAAAEKVAGLGQLFQGMGSAVPGLLAVGVAVGGIFAAFEEAKTAASAASQWQQRMSILGQTVRNQDGDWRSLSSAVQAWADVQEKTTQFSRDDAVQALTTLTATGMKLKDAMIVTRVSEDAAAATGRSLTEVNFALSEAMHGRTQALTELGLGTKQSIKDGMKFSDILKLIEKNMGGAAASAADTYAGKVAQLHNAMNTLQEKIGSALLPVLTKLATALVNLIENGEKTFSRWEKSIEEWESKNKAAFNAVKSFLGVFATEVRMYFDQTVGVIHAAWDLIVGDFKIAADLLTFNWKHLWSDVASTALNVWKDLTGAFGTFGQDMITIAERIAYGIGNAFVHMGKAMYDAIHLNLGAIKGDMQGALSGFADLTAGLKSLGGDAFSGLTGAFSSSGSGSNPTDIGDISGDLGDTQVGGKLAGPAKALHHIAKAAKHAKTQVQHVRKAMEDLYAIGDPFAKLMREANAAYGKTPALLAATERGEAGSFFAGIKDKETQQAELQKQLNEAQRKWSEYYKALEENARQWSDKVAGWIEEMFAHGKKGVNSFAETFKHMLKEIEQALLKSALFELFMGGKGGSFMSVFLQNMGLGAKGSPSGGMSPASILTMGASMIGGHSGVTSMLGGKGEANGSGGIIGALIGTSAATQLASSLPTDSLMSLMFGVGAPTVVGGLGGGSVAGDLSGAAQVIAGAGGPGGGTIAGSIANQFGSGILSHGLGSILQGGLPSIFKALGFGQGSIIAGSSGSLSLGGAGVGIAAGDLFAQLWNRGAGAGSHSTWGMIGGGLGGLFGGPVGGLIGGAIGSLFGHADNPANMPDKYDTQRYGTITADLLGENGANGQKFYEQSQLSAASGGKTGIAWIEETLAKYANPDGSPGPNTPAWLKPMWGQLVAAFGISASGSGHLNFGHAINNEWITGAQGVTASGKNPMQYTQLGNLLDEFYQSFITQGQTTIGTPNQPGSGNNGGFNVSSPFAGAYMVGTPGSAPQLVNGSPSFALNPDPGAVGNNGGVGAPIIPVGGTGGRRTMLGGEVHVTVNVAGNVTAEHNLAETIRQRIMHLIQHERFSNDMSFGGLGL